MLGTIFSKILSIYIEREGERERERERERSARKKEKKSYMLQKKVKLQFTKFNHNLTFFYAFYAFYAEGQIKIYKIQL